MIGVELLPEWPFLRRKPTEHELRAREALRKFEEVEQRALEEQEARIAQLEDDVEDIRREVAEL